MTHFNSIFITLEKSPERKEIKIDIVKKEASRSDLGGDAAYTGQSEDGGGEENPIQIDTEVQIFSSEDES